MKWVLPALMLFAAPATAGEALMPADSVMHMMGDVAVYDASGAEKCGVMLYEDEVPGGYRLEKYDACDTSIPVLGKITAWRAYAGGQIAFADDGGNDLIRFSGEGYTMQAITPVDGIVKIWSAQEVAE